MPRLRPSAQIFASLLWALPGVVALPDVAHAQTAPREALIVASRESSLTLGVGSDDGAKVGQTYRLRRGNVGAKIQIMALTPTQSTALVISADPGFSVAVGDTATYLGEEALQPPLRPTPATPNLPALPPAPASTSTSGSQNPTQALLTSVTGGKATLGIGAADGAVLGAVYGLPLAGNVKARLQITQVRPTDSVANISIVEEGFVPVVGDVTRFLGVESLPASPSAPAGTSNTPTTLPSVPMAPATPAEVPAPIVPLPSTIPSEATGGTGSTVMPPMTAPTVTVAPVSSLSGATATVTATQNGSVTISAGSSQGAKAGQRVPILRGGEVIGLLRLQAVSENSSSGVVLYRDESLAPIAPGDAVGLLGASPNVGVPQTGTVLAQNPRVPATAVKYETGASNFAVPKANPTYELLAALASSGLIQSQPPSVFQDDGARRHRTAEDILFSRAQVATFIREAIGNAAGDITGRDRAALSLLTKEFRRDLVAQGETEATLQPIQDGRGFGTSGFSRYTVTGGEIDKFTRDPFSESYGARRTKSGFDSRTNLFGQISRNLAFYGSVDYGSDIRSGTSNILQIANGTANTRDSLSNLQVRKAYLSYDAQNLLRGLTINLGRKEFWWGPGQFGTTVLSDAAGGLNSISSVFERGSYRLEGLYSYLGRGPAGGKRSLYGQNLSVKVGPSVRIGATTTILSPKETLDPKLLVGAFTPISLYVLDRQGGKNRGERNSNTNAVVGGYAEAAVARGARVYGEIVLDDLAVNEQNGVENRNGSLVGVQVFNPNNPAKAGFTAEYARLNSISYLAFLGNLDRDYYYQFRNAPLGYSVSPADPTTFGGSESLRFEAHYMPLRRLRINAGLEFADVNTEDQDRAVTGGRGFSRQQIYRLAIAYELSRSFSLTARAQKIDTNQPNFIKNEVNQKDRFFSLEIGRSF